MNYHPEGIFVWDTWYFHHEGVSHCIHLQQLRRGETPAGVLEEEFSAERGALGHATSTDLFAWKTQPTALYRGAPGSYDDYDLWTGCVVRAGETFFLFYTARSSRERGSINRIALATSRDTVHWERHPGNPIITPDSRWYHGESNPRPFTRSLWPTVDCRDLCVVRDPEGTGYWGFYAARQPAPEIASTAVIALIHSDDLVHWTHHPPCFAPGKYACIEVPEVFYLEGRWYLLCLTGNGYGQRNRTSEPNIGGPTTIYAVASRPQGPYMELDRNVLIGSESWQGFSGKTLEVDGKRYLLYTQGERGSGSSLGSTFGSVATPKLLTTDRAGHLLLTYVPRIEDYSREDLLSTARRRVLVNRGQWGSLGQWRESEGRVEGGCANDWAMQVYDASPGDFVFTAVVTLEEGRSAGLVFRLRGADLYSGAYVVLLDFDAQEVIFTKIVEFPRIEGRQWVLGRGKPYHLRVVGLGAAYNVYLDDILCLQLYNADLAGGKLGLFVEQGRASFRDLQALVLADTPREGA